MAVDTGASASSASRGCPLPAPPPSLEDTQKVVDTAVQDALRVLEDVHKQLRMDFEKSIDESNNKLQADIEAKNNKLHTDVQTLVHSSNQHTFGVLKTLESSFSKRFAILSETVAKLTSTTDKHERRLQEFEARFQKLEQNVRVLDAPEVTKKARDYDHHDRAPDLSLLRVGTHMGQEVKKTGCRACH